MKQAFFIAWHYQQSKKKHLVALISALSLLGIALGVAVLIIGLSAMNGFERELNQRILGVVPQVEILGYPSKRILDYPRLQERFKHNTNIKYSAPFVYFQAIMQNGTKLKVVQVKGVDATQQPNVSNLVQFVEQDGWQRFEKQGGLIVGAGIAKDLSLQVGDWVTLMLVEQEESFHSLEKIKEIRIPVTGILRLQGQLDHVYVFISLKQAQQLLDYKVKEATGITLSLEKPFLADQIRYPELANYSQPLFAQSWIQQFGYMYRDIQLIRSVMYLAMFFVMAVACFNIVSTLMMVVKDKQGDIAILRTMGANNVFIREIFLCYGIIVGMKGALLGIGLGVITTLNLTTIIHYLEYLLNYQFLSDGIYFIDFLPSQLQWQDVFIVWGCALVLGLLASVYPAYKACQISPARILMAKN